MKMMKFLLVLFLTVNTSYAFVIFDPAYDAKTIEDSKAFFNMRKDAVLDYYVKQKIKPLGYQGASFSKEILARIITKKKLIEAEKAILDPNNKVTAKAGTNFPGILGGACKRKGDYDFALTELVLSAYFGKDVLSKEAYTKLLDNFLTVRGNNHPTHRFFCMVRIPETENHILMTESARYLTNQLLLEREPLNLKWDNEKNGFNKWMLHHLRQFLLNDFEEYNSRPYQGYAIAPISNLATFAKDRRVKMAATLVLDYLSAKFAVMATQNKRQGPISRQRGYSRKDSITDGDHLAPRFYALVGNLGVYKDLQGTELYGANSSLYAAIGSYRVPDLIKDIILDRKREFFQKISHHSIEMYYNHPKYLLSAGGRFWNVFDMGSGKADGWAGPTNIIPHTGKELKRKNLIRIEGAKKEQKRRNTCLYKNFACGVNIKLPENLPKGCREDFDDFILVNYKSNLCPLKYGYYVVIQLEKTPWPRRQSSNFGFMEVVDGDKYSYEEVKEHFIKNKQTLEYRRMNRHLLMNGDTISYRIYGKNKNTYPIVRINDYKMERNFKRWPFLSGQIMSSKRDGIIKINNRKLGTSLILNYSDPMNPTRFFKN